MTDYISRESVLDAINDCGICTQQILDIPAAAVRPVVHGEWKLATYSGKFGTAKPKWYDQFLDGAFWYCDNCKERARGRTKICPNCGAQMDKGGDRHEYD